MAPSLVDLAPAPPAMDTLVRAGLADVVRTIAEELNSPIPEVQRLVAHVEGYRGKMLRPTLSLVAAAAVDPAFTPQSPRFREVVTVGAVIEIIHLATLVHDDVLDLASTRRGGPTVNAMNGNELAVILGDYLISKAFELCSRLPVRGDEPTATRVGQIASMVCEGEILQLSNRNNLQLPIDTYRAIIERKTAALIAVAAEQAVVHAIAPEHRGWRTPAAECFDLAADLGTAFQVQDDILDLTGSAEQVGKPLGVDVALGKLTLPLILHRDAGHDVEPLLSAPREDVVRALTATGSLQAATAEARARVNRALSRIGTLAPSPARDYLAALAATVLERRL